MLFVVRTDLSLQYRGYASVGKSARETIAKLGLHLKVFSRKRNGMRVNRTVLIAWVALLSVAPLGAADDLRLVEAVKNRDSAAVRTLLKQGIDVNARQPEGATALHWAAHRDDVETANLLIRAGAQVNVTNDYEVTPLALACTNRNPAMVETLLKAGANPNAALSSGETALMTAARTGSTEIVAALLARGADVNAKETLRGQTGLMWAAAEGHAEVARLLIERGADVHARSKAGSTPLLLTARKGDVKTTQILLNAGADVNEAGPGGLTVLMIATMRGHVTYAAFLLDQGANPNLGPGFTPLHWAAGEWPTEMTDATNGIIADDNEWSPLGGLRGQAKLDIVKTLLAHGADPNLRPKSDPRYGDGIGESAGPVAEATPFLLAAMAGNAGVMRLLAAGGADPRAVTSRKETALTLAVSNTRSAEYKMPESSYLEAAKQALDLGVDPNAINAAGETALHIAVLRGSTPFVQLLIDRGADLNVKNRNGWTPLTIAEGVSVNDYAPSPDIMEALSKAGAAPTPAGTERNTARIKR
jgi:ankyrin repeat protein